VAEVKRQESRVLPGRFRWLLEKFCEHFKIDTQEVDDQIDYYENLAHLKTLAIPVFKEWSLMDENEKWRFLTRSSDGGWL